MELTAPFKTIPPPSLDSLSVFSHFRCNRDEYHLLLLLSLLVSSRADDVSRETVQETKGLTDGKQGTKFDARMPGRDLYTVNEGKIFETTK